MFNITLRSCSGSLKRVTVRATTGDVNACCIRLNQKRCLSSSTSQNHISENLTGSTSTTSNPSDSTGTQTKEAQAEKGGFIRAMAKMEGHESFAKMLRNSPLVQMGDPQGKIVEGTIVNVVDDDLYIDFGAKFNCVCPRPQKNGASFALGKKVRIVVHDLELSTRFLGAKTDLTILEADCTLIGLLGKQERISAVSGSEGQALKA